MKRKPKWQLDFETQISLTNNEDLLSLWDELGHYVEQSCYPRSRFSKKCDLAYGEILRRLEPWSLAKGSFDPMGN